MIIFLMMKLFLCLRALFLLLQKRLTPVLCFIVVGPLPGTEYPLFFTVYELLYKYSKPLSAPWVISGKMA